MKQSVTSDRALDATHREQRTWMDHPPEPSLGTKGWVTLLFCLSVTSEGLISLEKV